MKDLIEYIAKVLVDNPEEVRVTELEGKQTSVIELRVAKGQRRFGQGNWQTRKNCQGNENYTWCGLDQVEKKICPGDLRVVEQHRS
jgi:hypothetical protein